MGYLLDTCLVSDFVKGEENTLKKLKSISPTEVFISSLTVMEVKYGLAINPQRAVKIQPIIENRTFQQDLPIDPPFFRGG